MPNLVQYLVLHVASCQPVKNMGCATFAAWVFFFQMERRDVEKLAWIHSRLSAKCSARVIQPYSISVYISPRLLAQKKKTFFCTNPELLSQCAISSDIIPRLDISCTSEASPNQGATMYVRSHLLYQQQGEFMTEILSLLTRWLPRESSAAGIADLEGSQVESE